MIGDVNTKSDEISIIDRLNNECIPYFWFKIDIEKYKKQKEIRNLNLRLERMRKYGY